MKKLLAILVIIATLFSLTSCAKESTPEPIVKGKVQVKFKINNNDGTVDFGPIKM